MSHVFRNTLSPTEPVPSEPARRWVVIPKRVRFRALDYLHRSVSLAWVLSCGRPRKDRICSNVRCTLMRDALSYSNERCLGSSVGNARRPTAPINADIT
jgi:hypothetical protein